VAGLELLDNYLAVIGNGRAGGGARLVQGQFHDVVLAGEIAYRFPRDEQSRRLLPQRVALLDVLATCRLPAAVPAPLPGGALYQPLGRCYAALRRLPGEMIGPEQMSSPQAESAVAADLVTLLDRLRDVGGDAAVRAAVPHADGHGWERFAAQVCDVLFPLMSGAGRARAEAELDRVLAVDPGGDALVHGDLGRTNLLLRIAASGPRLAGVLDWDEAHIGSQADDLASIGVSYGWPLAARIDAARHGGATPTLGDARAIAGTFALQQALPAALSGDAANLADGLTGYGDPPPPPSRS
jgi:aminoglycoside phosphotransferase (APT) family kinase protein